LLPSGTEGFVGAIEIPVNVTTVHGLPALATPPAAVTTTFPVVAPLGTVAVILELEFHTTFVARVPLNFTFPSPCDAPKLEPAIAIEAPIAPLAGVRLVILGAEVTVNDTPLLCTPPAAVTTTFPVVAVLGTVATMLPDVQVVIVVAVPLPNFTVPPVEGPRFDPLIVTTDPTAPLLILSEEMLGAGVTVNVTPVLACPPTVTTTRPVVAPLGTGAVMLLAPQAVALDDVPLKVTVSLFTWLERKFVPAITIDEPMAPVFGVRLVIVGVPLPKGRVICESKLPLAVPSISNSPLNAVEDVAVRFTPTHK
jgi:hypothetical protein